MVQSAPNRLEASRLIIRDERSVSANRPPTISVLCASLNDKRRPTKTSRSKGPAATARESKDGSNKTERYSVKGLIGSQDEAFDLTPEQVKDVERQAEEDDQKAHGRAFRAKRSPKDGLLILYLLRGEGIEGGGHIAEGPPFVGYCLSLPRDPDATPVEYVVNNVYDQQQLFNE